MDTRKACETPVGLERLRRRFERHRATQRFRSRIPDPLWAAAVSMAGDYGVNRTAKTLRLDYYGLKKRLEQRGAAAVSVSEAEDTARFVELAPLTSAASCECFLELENGSGARMRIQLKSTGTPDLAALSRTFWNHLP